MAEQISRPDDFPALAAPPRAIPRAGGPESASHRPAPPTKRELRALSRRAKAAIVVRVLLNEGADIPLETLPEALQRELTHQMGELDLVDRDTLMSVVHEFVEELEHVGLTFPKGVAGALSTLDGKISPHTAARLRKEAGVRQSGDPWARIRAADPEKLVPLLSAESTQVAAVILSKIEVETAAKILALLPGPEARRMTYAISQTGDVTPDAVDRIGLAIAAQLDAEPLRSFDTGPVERVGAILNSSRSGTRDAVLEGLQSEDEEFAAEVRKAIFTFAHIGTRIEPRDIPAILRGVDQPRLVTALKAAEATGLGEVVELILSSISKRLAENIREEMTELAEVDAEDGEEAMGEVVAAIRALQQEGSITLRPAEG